MKRAVRSNLYTRSLTHPNKATKKTRSKRVFCFSSVLFAPDGFLCGQRGRHVEDALVCAAAEPQVDVALGQNKRAVDQQIKLREQIVHRRIFGRHERLKGEAGVGHQVIAALFELLRELCERCGLREGVAARKRHSLKKAGLRDIGEQRLGGHLGAAREIMEYSYGVSPHIFFSINNDAAEAIFGSNIVDDIRANDAYNGYAGNDNVAGTMSRGDAVGTAMANDGMNFLQIPIQLLMGNISIHLG